MMTKCYTQSLGQSWIYSKLSTNDHAITIFFLIWFINSREPWKPLNEWLCDVVIRHRHVRSRFFKNFSLELNLRDLLPIIRGRGRERAERKRILLYCCFRIVLGMYKQNKLMALNFLRLLPQDRIKPSAHNFLIKHVNNLQRLQNGSSKIKWVWPTQISKF